VAVNGTDARVDSPADQAGLAIHRIRALGPEDLQPVLHPPRTRLPRSLVDAARWAATPDRACAVLAASVQQRLARPADLRAVLQRMPTARRRALLLRTIDDIDGGAHSLAEIHLVRLCRREGLPEPEQQVARCDRAGRRRWLDAYWSRWGCTSRSTAQPTWTSAHGGRTCNGRTRSGCAATGWTSP